VAEIRHLLSSLVVQALGSSAHHTAYVNSHCTKLPR